MGIKLHEVFADIADEAEEDAERLTEFDAFELGLDTGDESDSDAFGWRADS